MKKFPGQELLFVMLLVVASLATFQSAQASTCRWKGTTSTAFNLFSNWSSCGTVSRTFPQSTDSAIIPSGTTNPLKLGTSYPTITVASMTINSGATVTIEGATINAPVSNSGTIQSNTNGGTINGTLTTSSGSNIIVSGNSGGTLAVSGFTNNGTITLTSNNSPPTLTVTGGGTLTNSSTGSITTAGSKSGNLYAQLANQGTVTIAAGAPLTIGISSENHSNSGTITVSESTTLYQSSFTNSGGTIKIAAGKTLSVSNGTLNLTGGTLYLDLGGATSYGQVSGGTAAGITMGGTLAVNLVNSFAPSIGNTFTLITGAPVSGSFVTSYPTLTGGKGWSINYGTSIATIKVVDIEAPVVASFSIPSISSSLSVPINSFTATDNVFVTGYCITEGSNSTSCTWFGGAPSTYNATSAGAKTLYAWAKDAAGNVSSPATASVTIDTAPPTVTAFAVPSFSSSLAIPITTFTATDNNSVGGYCITEVNSSTSCTTWYGSAPSTYTTTGTGLKTLYAWAKDAAGNVSSPATASVTIDTAPPSVTAFVVPSFSSSLAIPITTFTATDNNSVGSYCITEVNSSTSCTWSTGAPSSYTTTSAGAKTLYAWAKDGAGNVSSPLTANVTVDTTPPTVTAFIVPSFSSSLAIPVTTFTASDNVTVGGFCITEVNSSTACVWSGSAPTSYTTTAAGARTLYAWAKDGAGNVSPPVTANVTVDTTPPTVTAFIVPSLSSSLTIPVTTFTASDNVTVGGFCITEVNSSTACVWSGSAPTSYTTTAAGARTLYAWAKDGAGNVSPPVTANVTIDTTPPAVTAFIVPSLSSSLTIPVTTFTASDNVSVAGFCITEVNSSSSCVWSGSAPSSYSTAAAGARTLYAWAKDTVGNISAPVTANVTVDVTPPVVTAFTVPSVSSTLAIPITTLLASDNIAVAGFCITEINSAGTCVWTASVPSNYTATSGGSKTLYAWAKDTAGNISIPVTAVVTVDVTPPVVTVFTVPSVSATLFIPVAAFTATDNIAVTGYCITEVNSSASCVWPASAPTSYTAATPGVKTLYAWAKDAAGNVSAAKSANVTVDVTPPVVTVFTVPSASSTLVIPITTFAATDNISVAGYCITEVNNSASCAWTAVPPTSYTFATAGAKIMFAWARDTAGNISAAISATVMITLSDTTAPVITAFTVPATSASLVIPVTSFTATDAVGVSGYMINETSIPPLPSDTKWSTTAPVSYTVATPGVKTLYAWAKDAAGNISSPMSANVTVTLPDSTKPVITAFTVPATSASLVIPITSFTATDADGVSGYMVNESATPPSLSDPNWNATAPTSYSATTAGIKTLYAWAKDAAGNVSVPVTASVTITLPDTTPPVITSFTVAATSTSLTVPVTSFTATDAVGVSGYMINETATPPLPGDAKWNVAAPASYTAATAGAKTLYAWAKDAAGNVSVPVTASVTITLLDITPPVITSFTVPATSTSLTIPVTGFTATDAVGVSGYMITETATPPLPGDAKWSAAAPVSYTVATAGAKTLYAWAKDAAGNISSPMSANVTVTLPDITPPVITAFIVPATSASLVIAVGSFTATDNIGVTGYCITEVNSSAACIWTNVAPASFSVATAGAKTLYAWAKDAAGNISSPMTAGVTITLSDTIAPVITRFIVPAASTTLTVSITDFTATDNVGVTGYLVTENSTVPVPSDSGWTSMPPASYTFASWGSHTLRAFAKDAAGNVSAPMTAGVTITLPDTTPPVITAFTVPSTSTSLVIPITSFTATDAVGVTGYCITTLNSPSDCIWASVAPASFAVTTTGTVTLYAWAKDAAGNISAPMTASVTISLPDTTPPVITVFTVPATSTSLVIPVTGFIATDAVGVTGYCITELNNSSDCIWTNVAPASFTAATAGSKTLYAWAKDAAGNVSAPMTASVTITLPDVTPPVITSFTVPATSTSLTIPVTSFTATDAVGVSGYMISETATPPLPGDARWSATVPLSYTVATPGAKTLYAWAKDAAGNISAPMTASVTVTLPDSTPPVITIFSIPATSTSLTIPVTNFIATDNVGVTGYCITEANSSTACNWSSVALSSFTAATPGPKLLYAWAKDAAGNISAPMTASVTVTLPDTTPPTVTPPTVTPPSVTPPESTLDKTSPVITTFTLPSTSTSLFVPVVSFTTTDAVGVTGYLVTESSTVPGSTESGWTSTPPASYTFASWGIHTLRAFAKDAAGNISAPGNATVTIGTDGILVPGSGKTGPTLADALKSLNFALKLEIPTLDELKHGDVAPLIGGVPQPDGEINLGDAIVTLRKVVGL